MKLKAIIGKPDDTPKASYRTAPLKDYCQSLQRQAEVLFGEVQTLGGRAKRYDGSYSILDKSSGPTVAKVVIYQHGVASARENGSFPPLADGVYVLLRTGDEIGSSIWNCGIVQKLGFAHRFDSASTIGIAPKRDVRFAYFRVAEEDEVGRIAEFLARI